MDITQFDLCFTDPELAKALAEAKPPDGVKVRECQPEIRASHGAAIVFRVVFDLSISVKASVGVGSIVLIGIAGWIAKQLKANIKGQKKKTARIDGNVITLTKRSILRAIQNDIAAQIAREAQWREHERDKQRNHTLPGSIRTLLNETIGHLNLEHRRKVDEEIRSLTFRLANQGLMRSSAANQEGVRILGATFDLFAARIWTEAKRVLERMSVEATTEQDITALLNAVLDSTIQADSQILLNVAEPRIGPLVVGQFQQRCQPARAKMTTEVKLFCRGLEVVEQKAPLRLISPSTVGPAKTLVRRTLTVIFTDIKGFSALVDQDEAATRKMLDQHNAVMDPCIPAHDGKLVKTIGDSYMVCFQSALDGLRCACTMQRAMAKLNRRRKNRIQVRIGVNAGDVLVAKNDDLYGYIVNVAKRIEAAAIPGGICVSESIRQNIASSERKQFVFQDAGKFSLKGSSDPVQCWHVRKSSRKATSGIIPTMKSPRSIKNYMCQKCKTHLQSTSQPSTFNCPGGGMHQWTNLGDVGSTNYQCKKCAVPVQSKSAPSTFTAKSFR